MIFHRLRLISFSKSLLSIKTGKKKSDVEVEKEDLSEVVEISTHNENQDLQDNTTECMNPVNSKNSVNSGLVKPRLEFKSKSESLRIFPTKKLKKCTKRKTLSLSDFRRRFSLKNTLNSNRIKQKLCLYKQEKNKKKNVYYQPANHAVHLVGRLKNNFAKKNDIKVLYTNGPWFRSHSSAHLRKRGMRQPQKQFCFYRNKRLVDPYTFYQKYTKNDNPFQKFRERNARKRKQFREASTSCPYIHHPLKVVTSGKIKSERCFCTDPLHYNLLHFPQSSKSKMARKNDLRLYRSEGLTTDKVGCYRIALKKPCSTDKVSQGQMVSDSCLPVECMDTAVSNCNDEKPVLSSKPSNVCQPSSKSSHGYRKCRRSTRKFPIAMFYSEVLHKIAGLSTDHSKTRSTLRTFVKYSLLGLVIIAWTPCMFSVMVCWLISYPFKFRHDISANNRKNYKCSKDCYHNQSRFNWLSKFTSFTARTPKEAKHAIFGVLGLQSTEPKNQPHSCSHPNPKRKYTLFHADGRGWVIKPHSQNHKQKRFMQVFHNKLDDHNRSNAGQKTYGVRRTNHSRTCTSCRTASYRKQHYNRGERTSRTPSKTFTPENNATLPDKKICKLYQKCVAAATTKTFLRNLVNSKKLHNNNVEKTSWAPSTPEETSRHQYVRPRKPVCRPKELDCVITHKSTLEKCRCAFGENSIAGKLLHSICMSLLKQNPERSCHIEPCTKSVCSGILHAKRSRSSNGRRSDIERVHMHAMRSRSAAEKIDDSFAKRHRGKRPGRVNECGPLTCQSQRKVVDKCGPLTCKPSDPRKLSERKVTTKCGPLTCQPSEPHSKKIENKLKCGPLTCQPNEPHSRKTENKLKCGPLTCHPSDPHSKKTEHKLKCGPLTCKESNVKKIDTSEIRSPSVSDKDGSLKGHSKKQEHKVKTKCGPLTCQPSDPRSKKSERKVTNKCGSLTCQPSDRKHISSSQARSPPVSEKDARRESRGKKLEHKDKTKCGPLTCQSSDPHSKNMVRNVMPKCGLLTCQPSDRKNVSSIQLRGPPAKKANSLASGSPKSNLKKTEHKDIDKSPRSSNTSPIRSLSVTKKDVSLAKGSSPTGSLKKLEHVKGSPNGSLKISEHSNGSPKGSLKKLNHKTISKSPRSSQLNSPTPSKIGDSVDKDSHKKLEPKTTNKHSPFTNRLSGRDDPQNINTSQVPNLPISNRKAGTAKVQSHPKKKGHPKKPGGPVPPGSKRKVKAKQKPKLPGSKPRVFSRKKPKGKVSAWFQNLHRKAGKTWRAFLKKSHEAICTTTCNDLYLHTLRSRPWFWVYRMCPKMYPQFLKCYYTSQTGCYICVTVMSVCFWAPIICWCYICFQLCTCCCS